jgi:MFS family permease
MAWNLAGLSLLAPVVAPLAGKLIDVFGVSRRLKTASPFVEKLLASLTGLIMIGIFLMLIAGVAFCGLIAGLYIWIAPNSGPLAATLVAIIVVVTVVGLGLYAARRLWQNVRQNIDLIANDGRDRHDERAGAKSDDHKPEGVIHAFAEGFKAGRKL